MKIQRENEMNATTFDQWMEYVDKWVAMLAGCSVYDLPDCCFADWFADGMAAKTAARKAIKAAKSGGR